MKKTILLAIIISTFLLAGCTTNNQTTVNQNSKKVDGNQSAKTEQNNTTNKANDYVEKTENSFLIPETGIKIVFPEEYTIAKSNEENRRGSFVSYDFSYKTLPSLQEIQFFSKESIQKFTANCGTDTTCFFGDYPDLTRYNGQKNAFNKGENYKNYELKKIGDRNYFVSNFKCNGDNCVIREYTTFINSTKVDVWITMAENTQANAADNLFNKFKIIE